MKEKVLIVADSRIVGDLAKSTLQQEGYQVQIALQDDAMNAIPVYSPNLIIIDHTEARHGGTLCRKLKKAVQTAQIPVLLMSPLRELSQVYDQFLADDFIYRPYILRLLIDKVNRLLAA